MIKKFFIIVVGLLVYTCNLDAQTYISMRPNWTFNPPPAENSTYEYYVSRGVGNTEKEARKDAFVLAVKEAQSRVGVSSNSTEIFKSFQNNDVDFNVIASAYEIPMKEVCYFSEKSRDGYYYYYQLLQVAISGNISPNFRPFSGDCYDFSKAKELREIMKEEYKEKIEEEKKRQEQEAKVKAQEDRKNKRLNNSYCDKNKHRYVAWNIAGAGYPWNLVTGIEFRAGGLVGFGLYGDIGMDFTTVDYYYYDGSRTDGTTVKTAFRYDGGVRFYPYRGLFVDCGYGSIANAKTSLREPYAIYSTPKKAREAVQNSHGILFHAGYNLVTDLSYGAGFFLGLSGGASYDVINKVFAPSVNLKIGVAWGWYK